MTTELTVSISLDSDDPQGAARLEENLRGWLEQQPGVTGMAIADQGHDEATAHIWRAARRSTFGSGLRNPFAP